MRKYKSPQNYRRKKRTATKGYDNIITIGKLIVTNADTALQYFGQEPTTTTSTISVTNGTFDAFSAGDLITISNGVKLKQSKKVHPARRRIPKRNNGTYVITNIDSSTSITIKAAGTTTITEYS